MKDTAVTALAQGRGAYIVLRLNIENGTFDRTPDTIEANTLTPIGFPFSITHSEFLLSEPHKMKPPEQFNRDVFKAFYEKLAVKCQEIGAPYVLTQHFKNDGPNIQKEISIECQGLIPIDPHRYSHEDFLD